MTSLWNSAHVLLFLHTCRAVHCLLWCTGPAFSSPNAGLSTSRKVNAADLAPRATDSSVFLPVIWKRPKRGAHSTLFIDSLNEKSRVYHVPGQQILPCCCCCSFSKSCPSLCGPMNCSTPGSSVLYCLPEFALIHVHWVGDALWLPHPLPSPSPRNPWKTESVLSCSHCPLTKCIRHLCSLALCPNQDTPLQETWVVKEASTLGRRQTGAPLWPSPHPNLFYALWSLTLRSGHKCGTGKS